ncbi:MAG: transporter substrate-binding domain-containing protein [Bacteroidales bacterium]
MINYFIKYQKFLYLFLTALLICAISNYAIATNSAIKGKLIIRGGNGFAPFEFINNKGVPDGFTVDITKALMKELKCTDYEIKLQKWDTVFRDIKDNKIDIVLGMTYSPERSQYVKFGLPLCTVSNSIVCRKKDNYRTLEELRGKSIIVQGNSGSYLFLVKANITNNIIAVSSIERGIKLLSQGIGDAVLGNELVAYYAIKANNIKKLSVRNLGLQLQNYSLAVNKNNEELLYQLNVGIQSLKTNGKYDEIYNKWFGVFSDNNSVLKTFITALVILLALILLLLLFLWLLRKQVKRATLLLSNSKQELEMAIDAGKISAWTYNIDNHVISSLHGLIVEDGKVFEEILKKIHPDDGNNLVKSFTDLSTGERIRTYECFRIKEDSNDYYSVYETIMRRIEKTHNLPCHIVGTLKDVTAEVKLKNKLEDYKIKTNFITDTNGIVLMEYNIINRTFIKVNNSGENDKEGGYTREEYLKIVHPQDIELVEKFLTNMEEHLQERISTEFRCLSSNLEYEWYSIDTVAYRHDDSGKITSYLGIRRNNTKWKQIEVDLINLRDKAEASSKLKSAFLANMSHEIRTPLNAIVGFSNLISEADNKEDQGQYKRIIKTNSELLLQLIDDILDLSRIEAGYMEFHYKTFNFNEFFNELGTILLLRKPQNIEFIAVKHNYDFKIYSDKVRISQIITNFVINAFKFTKNGSVTIDYKYTDEYITISVTDTGIGISEENMTKVFNRFEKINEFVQGTGLGLPICKALAIAMNGDVSVESTLGKGSTFSLTIPYNNNNNNK